MAKKIKFFLLGILLTINLQANAQEFYISNNNEVRALASKHEITRIAFDSIITEVHAISEEIEYVINGKDIYLRMLTQEKPVNFFVKCEDETTYKLLLIAQDAPADQIFVHSRSAKIANAVKEYNSSQTEYFGQVLPEVKTKIAKIIEVALTPSKHLGFNIAPKNLIQISPNKDLKVKLEMIVSGNQLIAEKIRLTNKSEQPIQLDLRDFADPKYLVVYLRNKEILPKQETILIRAQENQ